MDLFLLFSSYFFATKFEKRKIANCPFYPTHIVVKTPDCIGGGGKLSLVSVMINLLVKNILLYLKLKL